MAQGARTGRRPLSKEDQMSNPTATSSEPRMVPLARINVADGHNPRRTVDADELASLTTSVREFGVITPIAVAPDPDTEGDFVLIAGERRYRAACEAALTEIPAVVRVGTNGDAIDIAITENLQRQDLNPVDEAHGFERALQREGVTQAKLAERLGINPRRISEALRLPRLPESAQEAIATGAVAVKAVRAIEQIAKVSEQVAEAVIAAAAADPQLAGVLADRPGEAVSYVAQEAAEDPDSDLVCVPAASWQPHDVTELPLPSEQADQIAARVAKLPGGQARMSLAEADIDAARAYGCLLEFEADEAYFMRQQWVCNAAWLADRVLLALDGLERQVAERQKTVQQQAGKSPAGGGGGGRETAAADEAEVKAQRQAAAEEERQRRIEVRGANLTLGSKLAEKFHEPKLTNDVAELVALCVLDRDTADLAARGLRLVREDWQEDQSHTLKSGEHREKIAYLSPVEAEEALWEWLAKARTPEQKIGRVVQALIAARHADESLLAQSNQAFYSLPGGYGAPAGQRIPELVDKLAKRVLPRRPSDEEVDGPGVS